MNKTYTTNKIQRIKLKSSNIYILIYWLFLCTFIFAFITGVGYGKLISQIKIEEGLVRESAILFDETQRRCDLIGMQKSLQQIEADMDLLRKFTQLISIDQVAPK